MSALTGSRPPIIPLRDFFRNPEKTAFKISPDGRYVSHMEPFGPEGEQRLNVFVQKREELASDSGAAPLQVTNETARDIGGHWWKNDHRIVYTRDFGGDENYHLFAVDRDGKNNRDLTPFEGVRVEVVDELIEIENEILIRMNRRDAAAFDVFRLNVETGAMQLIAENPGPITRWITDHNGKVRVAQRSDGVNNTLLYRDTEQDEFREIVTTHFKESLDPMFFTFDNKDLYVMSNIGRDKLAIVTYNVEHAREMEVVFEHPEVDVEGVAFSKKRKVLTVISYTTWKQQLQYFDKEMEQLYASLNKRLPNYEIAIVDHTRDERTFIVRTYSDRSLGAFYLYDSDRDELQMLAQVSPWLDEQHLAPMTPVTFQSRDGLTIHGYLTLPVGRSDKNLPVVVNPHGGPWHRDRWMYNPEVQFLANRGYAVFQINFRGSTGYGRKFWEASFKQWGRAMQDDVTDGVRWLTARGIADNERIAIYGGSYGGYCTLAGVTFTPELYACGIDYVGVSNLFTFMRTIPPYWKPFLESMYQMVGDPEKDQEMLRAASPVFHVERIKAPLLVIQGAKDPRVNIDESDQIVRALEARGVPVQYIVKDNEGHGFRNEENRFEVYDAIERFLQQHLGTDARD
jgi:dipeptidyl aminopeptidase/acylaminoacyl peptidase